MANNPCPITEGGGFYVDFGGGRRVSWGMTFTDYNDLLPDEQKKAATEFLEGMALQQKTAPPPLIIPNWLVPIIRASKFASVLERKDVVVQLPRRERRFFGVLKNRLIDHPTLKWGGFVGCTDEEDI